MSDLVERLKIEASEDLDGEVRESAIEVMREAATALTAKDKEIEALRGERDDALSRVEELELSAEVVSDEFEKDCWKAMRRLLNECKFDWRDVDQNEGISAEDAFEHVKTTLDELEATGERWKARAETAERERDEAQFGFEHELRIKKELAGALRKAERERDRIADELDTMNNNHRVMAKLLADTAREWDEARAASTELTDYIKSWTSPSEMRQRAGEMTAQEVRTVQAILSAILDHARAARAVIEQGE